MTTESAALPTLTAKNAFYPTQSSGASRPGALHVRGALLVFCCLMFTAVGTVRAQSVVAALSAGSSPYAVALNPVTNKIYVANQTSDNVTVIDGASNSTTTVGTGTRQYAVAVNSVTNKIYVTNALSDNVTVIDGTTNSTTTVSAGTTPGAVAVNPVTNKIYVANVESGNVTVIDGATNSTTTVRTGTYPYAVAVNPVTNKIYVANLSSDNVTVIDGESNSTTTVTVGSGPFNLAVNQVTNKVYVTNSMSDNVTVIDGTNNSTATLAVGSHPVGLAVNLATNKIYVANQTGNNVTVIDGATNSTTTLSAGTYPSTVVVDQVTNKVYVTNSMSDNITVIDGTNNSTVTLVVGSHPKGVAVNPVTNYVYVANQGSNNVSVINGSTNVALPIASGGHTWSLAVNQVTNKIYAACEIGLTVIDGATNARSALAAGYSIISVAVNPVTDKVYAADSSSGSVIVIDGATNTTSTVMAGSNPQSIAVNAVTNKIYVANFVSNNVTAIDGATNATTTIAAGVGPSTLAVNPVTNKIYVANYVSNDVTVIDGATNLITTVPVGSHPQSVAVNPVTNKIYVVNRGADVTVIDGASNATATVSGGNYPYAVAVNPITNKIYVSSFFGDAVTVIDGVTNSTSTIAAGHYPRAVAVNSATNMIYTSGDYGIVTVIDGASGSATTVGITDGSLDVAVNLATNKVYFANHDFSRVTVIAPAATQDLPLTAQLQGVTDEGTVPGLAVFATSNASPAFTAVATSSYTPTTPSPTALYYQLDTKQGTWQRAMEDSSAGANPTSYKFSFSNLPLGVHTVYAYAVSGNEGTLASSVVGSGNSPDIGNVAATTFAILPIQTTTTLTADANPQVVFQNVTLTAYVMPQSTGTSEETGTVTFFDGSTVLGQMPLDSTGHAAFAATTLPVGSHSITATYSGDAGYLGSSGNLQLTIEKATPVIAWADPTDLVYGSTLGSTQLNATASVPGSFTYTPTQLTRLSAGNGQTLHVNFVPDDSTNYNNAAKDVHINVLKATLTPHVTANDKVYDGTVGATLSGATLTGVIASDDVTLTCGEALFADKNVGSNKAVNTTGCALSGPAADNYELSSLTSSTTASITVRALHVTASGVDRVYNGTTSATVTLADDRVVGDVLTIGYAAVFADKNVGSSKPVSVSSISISGADLANYFANSTTTTTASITPFPLTVTATVSSRAYDSSTWAANQVTLADNRFSGDSLTMNWIAYFADKNAGEDKPVTVEIRLFYGQDAGNYTYNATVNTTATITKANASVTPNAASKAYGSADPLLTGTMTGFVAADGITATHTRTPGETVAGGPYAISATLNPVGALVNYNVTYNTAAFTINKASASVTPNAATKIYGSADPAAFTGTLSGFIPADNVTATYSRVAGETVTGGPYAISAVLSPAGVLANYNITNNPVAFTISPAPLTVAANAKSRLYGAANPSLDGTVNGVLNNDGITANYSTTATVSSNVGIYPITGTLVDPNGRVTNYAVTSTPGTMTITPAPTTTVVGASSIDTLVGTSVTISATVALASGTGIPTGTVTFKDGAATLGTNSLDATGKATFSFSSTIAGAHSITAAFGGSLNTINSASTNVSVNLQDFVMPATPPSIVVLVGQSTTSSFTVTPASGFTGTISFTCAVPSSMSEASCAASPVQITGTSGVGSILTVATTGPHHVAASNRRSTWYAANAIFLVGFAWLGVPVWRRRRVAVLIILVLIVLIGGAVGCGVASGLTDPGTIAGTYTLSVTATSGTAVHTMNVPVTVR